MREGNGHMLGRGIDTCGGGGWAHREFGLHVRGGIVMGGMGTCGWRGRAHYDDTPLIVCTILVCTQQVRTCGI